MKTLMKSRSLLFAEVHDKELIGIQGLKPKMEISHRAQTNNNVVCLTSKCSDLPAHTRSLIRDFASFNIL